jgi:hypothetical protein
MRPRRVVWPAALVVVIATAITVVGVVVSRQPHTTTIPGSHVQFDQPASWHAEDPAVFLDPEWAKRQKARFPDDAAFIDATVEGFRSGAFDYSAWIDLNGDGRSRDSSVEATFSTRSVAPDRLAAEALRSMSYQPVIALPGATAVDVTIPGGRAARLDWRLQLNHTDGTTIDAAVRSYWILDQGSIVVIQLTSYGSHPDDVASFETAIGTLRWMLAPGGSLT